MPLRQPAVAFAALLLLPAAIGATAGQQSESFPGGARAVQGQPTPPACCFASPRYTGTCEVQPSKDETCASILEYLNNPQSQGKAYCGNTNVRGDWTQVSCGQKAASPGWGARSATAARRSPSLAAHVHVELVEDFGS